MITLEQWQRVRHLNALGWSGRRIAQELGLNRRTVARALALTEPPRYQRPEGASAVEPWKAEVEAGLRRGLRGSSPLPKPSSRVDPLLGETAAPFSGPALRSTL